MKTSADVMKRFIDDLETRINELKSTKTGELLEQIDCLRKQLKDDEKDDSKSIKVYQRIPIGIRALNVIPGAYAYIQRQPQIMCKPTHLMMGIGASHFELHDYSIGHYIAKITTDMIPLACYKALECNDWTDAEKILRYDAPTCEPGMLINLTVSNISDRVQDLHGVILCDVSFREPGKNV